MRLVDYLRIAANVNWSSPAGPDSQDYYGYHFGLSPGNHEHAPSLRNPKKTIIPTGQDGWHKGDSKEAKEQAIKDLVEIHKRLRRQLGKPEIAQTALYPLFPNIATKL